MKTVAFFSSKGGSGKSTLSIHVAVAAALQQRVVLIDCDPQGTVTAWASKRGAPSPMVVRSNPSDIDGLLESHRAAGFELAVMDCPPHAAAGTAMLLAVAHHVAVPVQPTVPDLAAVHRAMAMLKANGRPFSFVLSRAPARAPEIEQTRVLLRALGPLAPGCISDRRVFSRALIRNSAVTEIVAYDHKAAAEIRAYCGWLQTQTEETTPWQAKQVA